MESPVAGRLGELFVRVTRRLREAERTAYAPWGLTPAQGRLLGVLARSPGSMHMIDLARELGVVPRAVTPLVDLLEGAGLVRRRVDPANRRAILIDLTEEGATTRQALVEARVRAAESLFAPLAPEQRSTLLGLLEAVATAPRVAGA